MDSGWGAAPIEANVLQHHSPLGYSGVKSKMRKKVTTFAVPPVDLVIIATYIYFDFEKI